MRTALGLAVFAVGIMACGTTPVDRGTATAAIKRDITLQNSATEELQVASPVELGRAQPKHITPHRKPTPKPAPAPTTSESAPLAAPAPELVSAPAPVAVAEAPTPAPAPSGRELAPGQTVQIIPASSGPSNAGPETTYVPTDGRGFKAGGGHCPTPPRRGRPIGVGYR